MINPSRSCRYRKTLNFMVMENIFYAGDYGAIEPVIKPNAVYLLCTHVAKPVKRSIDSVKVHRGDSFLDVQVRHQRELGRPQRFRHTFEKT